MFEKAGGTSAIQRGTDRGMVCFNGPKPRGILWMEVLRGAFEIAGLAGRVVARPECKGKTEKNQRICQFCQYQSVWCARLSEA
jgi:hypothetical protein